MLSGVFANYLVFILQLFCVFFLRYLHSVTHQQ